MVTHMSLRVKASGLALKKCFTAFVFCSWWLTVRSWFIVGACKNRQAIDWITKFEPFRVSAKTPQKS